MLGSFRNRRAGVLIWALLVALVIGLAGFGIGAGRGISSQNVAKVGGRPVTADEYVRAMQQELRALNQQLGRDLPISVARQYGVDGMVLARLVNDAALDNEAARLGVSPGDATVLSQVTATPAFVWSGSGEYRKSLITIVFAAAVSDVSDVVVSVTITAIAATSGTIEARSQVGILRT